MDFHHPPHLSIGQWDYFITATTYHRQALFVSEPAAKLLFQKIQRAIATVHGRLDAWVIMPDHYHLLLHLQEGATMSKLMNTVHGRVSYQLNRRDAQRGRKLFQNYWDRYVRDETDYWHTVNYIHWNPVKQGLARTMGDYPWSSYREWVQRYGQSWMDNLFETLPIEQTKV